MRVFRMSGRPILSPSRFKAYFSPVDFLAQRELAAGFARAQFWQMHDALHFYACRVLWSAVFHPEKIHRAQFNKPDDYFQITGDRIGLGPLLPEPEHVRLAEKILEVVREVHLSETTQKEIFCTLVSGYLLADASLLSCPLSSGDVLSGYIRSCPNAQHTDVVSFEAPGEIRLMARPDVYRIYLDEHVAKEKLSAGGKILPRKIVAEPHWQGNEALPVRIDFYAGDIFLNQVSLAPGDYRYINCVDAVPFYLHPLQITTGTGRLWREKNTLIFERNDEIRRIPLMSRNVICLAPEENVFGFVLLTEDGVDYKWYSLRKQYPDLIKKNVVEVRIQNGVCQVLCRDGSLYSSDCFHKRCEVGLVRIPDRSCNPVSNSQDAKDYKQGLYMPKEREQSERRVDS